MIPETFTPIWGANPDGRRYASVQVATWAIVAQEGAAGWEVYILPDGYERRFRRVACVPDLDVALWMLEAVARALSHVATENARVSEP